MGDEADGLNTDDIRRKKRSLGAVSFFAFLFVL